MGFRKTLISIVLATIISNPLIAKSIKYHPGYGFLKYKLGLLNKQKNWQSSDSLDNKGWQIINIKSQKNRWKSFDHNILCFKPSSDFKTFSPKDNNATFHIHTKKPIKTFTTGGEFHIEKNGFIDVYVSGDNKNWTKIEHFNSRGREIYIVGYGSTLYHANILPWRGIKITNHPYLKLDKDLYIRYSVGAKSNEKYKVEIRRFSVIVNSK